MDHAAVVRQGRALRGRVAEAYTGDLQRLWCDERARRRARDLVGAVAVSADEELDAEPEGNRGARLVVITPPPPTRGDFCSLALLPIDDPGFRRALPLHVNEFSKRFAQPSRLNVCHRIEPFYPCRSLRRGLRVSRALLERLWLPEAAAIVHAHIAAAREPRARDAAAKAAKEAPRIEAARLLRLEPIEKAAAPASPLPPKPGPLVV